VAKIGYSPAQRQRIQDGRKQRDKTILLIKIFKEQFGGGGWLPPPRG
jgi:hypothetical protein